MNDIFLVSFDVLVEEAGSVPGGKSMESAKKYSQRPAFDLL